MKLLGYCLLCLFVARAQSKPEITKLFPVESLAAYQKQLSNATRPLERFFGKLRATYNFVFSHQPDNSTSRVEKIPGKDASNSQFLRIAWADTTRADDFANLKYPDNSWFDHVKSLSMLQNRGGKTNSSVVARGSNSSTVETKSTIKINATKHASSSEKSSSNKTKTLKSDDDNGDWFNDIEPLSQLELQDELDDKNEVEIATTGPTFPTTLSNHLAGWLGSFFGLTSNIYAKLAGVVCGK